MINFLLQAAPNGGGNLMMTVIMFGAIFAIMYFFMIRPQQKQRKEIQKFQNELQEGTKVVTGGGIYGTVAEVADRTVIIKVDGEVKLRVDKNSLVRDYTQDTPAQQ